MHASFFENAVSKHTRGGTPTKHLDFDNLPHNRTHALTPELPRRWVTVKQPKTTGKQYLNSNYNHCHRHYNYGYNDCDYEDYYYYYYYYDDDYYYY